MSFSSDSSSTASTPPRCHKLSKSDITSNCVTYLLPLSNPLADRQTRKTLILRKVCDFPLLVEDLAARTYYEANYFELAPPKLNIRAGPYPRRPEALRDLEARPLQFSFKASISLDTRYKIGGADVAWPCYLVSDILELEEPWKLIIPPHQQYQRQDDVRASPTSSPAAKRQRIERCVEQRARGRVTQPSEQTREQLSETKKLRDEVISLKQQVAQIKAADGAAREHSGDLHQLRRDVESIKEQMLIGSHAKLDLEALEAGYERLLRAAYEEWRRQLSAVEQNAASIIRSYKDELKELRSIVKRLENRSMN